jgi:hypothetical protein
MPGFPFSVSLLSLESAGWLRPVACPVCLRRPADRGSSCFGMSLGPLGPPVCGAVFSAGPGLCVAGLDRDVTGGLGSIVAGDCTGAGCFSRTAGVVGADGCTADPGGTGASLDTGFAVGSCTTGANGFAGGAGSVGGSGPGCRVGDAGRGGCSRAQDVRYVGTCRWIRALHRWGSRRCGGVSDVRVKICCRRCALSHGVCFLGNWCCIRGRLGGGQPRRRFCAGPRHVAAGGERPRTDRRGEGQWPAAFLGLHAPGSGGHPWSSCSLLSNFTGSHGGCARPSIGE